MSVNGSLSIKYQNTSTKMSSSLAPECNEVKE